MMEEVVTRRYKSDVLKSDPLPDLVIIDGGKGQLNVARQVFEKLQLSFPVISIAKKNEEVFVEWSDDPIIFESDSPILHLIQYVRDESHRFAINYHKLLRRKSMKSSIFENIKGIGKAKVQLLFHEFKDLNGISTAAIETIQKLLSVNEEIAKKVIELAKENVHKPFFENK